MRPLLFKDKTGKEGTRKSTDERRKQKSYYPIYTITLNGAVVLKNRPFVYAGQIRAYHSK